jgi:hypothetical protein
VELVIEGGPVFVADTDALSLAVELPLAVMLADPLAVLLALAENVPEADEELETKRDPVLFTDTDTLPLAVKLPLAVAVLQMLEVSEGDPDTEEEAACVSE